MPFSLESLILFLYSITKTMEVKMGIIDLIIVILLVAWLGGFSMHIAGGLIHLLIVIAIVLLIIRLLGKGRNL